MSKQMYVRFGSGHSFLQGVQDSIQATGTALEGQTVRTSLLWLRRGGLADFGRSNDWLADWLLPRGDDSMGKCCRDSLVPPIS